MKVRVSLPGVVVEFADREASRLGTTRSEVVARALAAARTRVATLRYLDRFGWDIVENEAAWRKIQRRRFAADYADDVW